MRKEKSSCHGTLATDWHGSLYCQLFPQSAEVAPGVTETWSLKYVMNMTAVEKVTSCSKEGKLSKCRMRTQPTGISASLAPGAKNGSGSARGATFETLGRGVC